MNDEEWEEWRASRPVYLYRCESCGIDIEYRTSMGTAPETILCPKGDGCEVDDGGIARRVYTPLAAPAFPGSHAQEYRKT